MQHTAGKNLDAIFPATLLAGGGLSIRELIILLVEYGNEWPLHGGIRGVAVPKEDSELVDD